MLESLLLASGNKKKLLELRGIFDQFNLPTRVLSPEDLSLNPEDLRRPDGASISIEETGSTFAENALIKARGFYQASGIPALSDDSGLCVDALNGDPGIYSARYGGPDLNDPGRNALLLKNLEGLWDPEQRKAHFLCVLCLVQEGQDPLYFEGRVDGWIAPSPGGDQGFGYDPVFIEDSTGERFAELDPARKAELSHRGKAMRKLAAYLKESI